MAPADRAAGGYYNHGWDDEHYDYIVSTTPQEIIQDRYQIQERIGKVSQVKSSQVKSSQVWCQVWCQVKSSLVSSLVSSLSAHVEI